MAWSRLKLIARAYPGSAGRALIEPGYGWLPAVIPASAQRFRVTDPELARILQDAGRELVRDHPHVAIERVTQIRDDADISIVVLGQPAAGDQPLLARAVVRIVRSVKVRVRAFRAARLMRRMGYPLTRTLLWDHGMSPPSMIAKHASLRSRLTGYLAQRALVTGTRCPLGPTLLDEVIADATAASRPQATPRPLVRAEVMIMETPRGVLRAAMGPGRRQIAGQRSALAALDRCHLPRLVADCVPKAIAAGSRGGVEWSLESRLPGGRPSAPLNAGLLAECLDFLSALHSACPSGTVHGAFLDQAEVVSAPCGPAQAAIVHNLAEHLEDVLADLPRGFAHGDFFHANLLADGDRLVGVIDWDAAGRDRLPFLDLFHLHLLSRSTEVADLDWGPLVVHDLIPLARAGGDATIKAYARRAGLEAHLSELLPLVVAYWLDYIAYHIRAHSHRLSQSRWVQRNVHFVAGALGADPRLR